MLLTSTSDIVRIVTSSTADIHVQASWADITTTTFSPGRTNTIISSATTTTIVGSPASSTQRQVKTLSIYNAHAATSNTITVQHYDGTNSVNVYKITLAAGDRAQYNGDEWPSTATGTGVTDGDKGDITVASSGTSWTIDTPSSATIAVDDKVLIKDTSASDVMKYVTTQAVADLCLNTSGNYVSGGTDVAVADGGTGRSTATAYAPIVGGTTSTGALQSTASGSAGQILQSAGSAAIPTWSTPTYPSSSGTSGKFLLSDGTNNVYSTSTIPTSAGATALKHLKSDGTNYVLTSATISDTPGTAGKILISDGTNWITSTPTFPNSSATSGKHIKSDGTNWVATSVTFPDSGTSRKMIVGNGTNYVESTESWAVPGSAGNLLRSDGTNWIAAQATLTTDVTGILPVANGGTNASSAGITAFNNITGYTASGATGTTSTNIVFSTSPTLVTPVLGVASATSINFGQTALNNYDEGTWTPVFSFDTPGDLSVTYSQQTGRYTRIGRLVTCVFTITCTPTFTTSSGELLLSGLPFSASQGMGGSMQNTNANVTIPAGRTYLCPFPTTTNVKFRALGSGVVVSNLTISNVTSGVSTTLVGFIYYT